MARVHPAGAQLDEEAQQRALRLSQEIIEAYRLLK